MKRIFKKMMQDQVQTDLNNLLELIHKPIPNSGWLTTIRKALGMTTYQLAKRLNCSQSNITALERREKAKTISLESLEETAQALNCKLVYFLLPETSFKEILEKRARIIAKKRLSSVDHSMELEQQGLTATQKKQQENDLVKELLEGNLKLLWENEDEL